MNDLESSVYEVYAAAGLIPNKRNLCEVYGVSYSTLLRKGFRLPEVIAALKTEYRRTTCISCKSVFSPKNKEQKFCSRSCSATFNNLNAKRETKRLSVCQNCGKYCESKFCSGTCSSDFRKSENLKNWLNGEDAKASNRRVRSYLGRLSGERCSCCGIKTWNGKPITLEVEHIDGNSEDSSPGNVCLLCPNCHSQTDTYKSKNLGNGRHSRRQRYESGKSY